MCNNSKVVFLAAQQYRLRRTKARVQNHVEYCLRWRESLRDSATGSFELLRDLDDYRRHSNDNGGIFTTARYPLIGTMSI